MLIDIVSLKDIKRPIKYDMIGLVNFPKTEYLDQFLSSLECDPKYIGAIGNEAEILHDIIDDFYIEREISTGVMDDIITTWHEGHLTAKLLDDFYCMEIDGTKICICYDEADVELVKRYASHTKSMQILAMFFQPFFGFGSMVCAD